MKKTQIFNDIEACAAQNGYKIMGNNTHGFGGSKGGYPFAIIGANSYVAAIITAPKLKADREKSKEFYKQMANNNIVFDSLYEAPNVVKLLFYPNKLGENYIEKGLTIAAKALEQLNIEKPKKCCICGKENCDCYGEYAGGYRPMHKNCIQEMVLDAQKTEKSMLKNGSYFKGIPGAVLGMLVGLALAGVSMILFNSLAAVMLVLVPMFINYGYRRTGGKPSMQSLYITGGFSLVAVAVMQIMTGIKGHMSGLQFSFSAALPEIIVSVIFVALGTIGVWLSLKKIPGTAKKQGEYILSTLSEISPK